MTYNMSFNLTAGVSYTLSYYLAGSQRGDSNTVTVQFAGQSTTNTLPTSQGYTLFTLAVRPGTNMSSTISFDHAGGDNLGLLLDDVSLTDSARVVPEPSTVGLMLSGLGAAFVARRRVAK